ncbi:MAG: WbuC family cupin fold metalloprotein [Betaproteobacteria bacterium]
MNNALLIDQALLARVSAEAKVSPRQRKNLNFHGSDTDSAHRLLNAIEPESYLAPHRHLDPRKDETMIVLCGRMGIVLFDEAGKVTQTHVLEAGSPVCGITIPHGLFHTLVSLQSGSVMFESKAGPYVPLEADERAPWASAEGCDGVGAYAVTLRKLFGQT